MNTIRVSSPEGIRAALAELDAVLTAAAGGATVDGKAVGAPRDAALVQAAVAHGWLVTDPVESIPRLAPATTSGVVAGFDLGGTKVRGGLADMAGRCLAETEEPTRHGHEGAVLDQLASMLPRLLGEAGLEASAVHLATVGVPGAVSPTGHVSLSPNLRIPTDRPLVHLMTETLKTKVVLENDVNLAAFGERWRGHGSSTSSLAFLSFGTGVGAGIVLGGELVRGAHGLAGEISYLPGGSDPAESARGSLAGAFEDLVGSDAIRGLHGGGISVREIFSLADRGDAHAEATIGAVARRAASGIAAVSALFDPEVIVLGGGIGSRTRFVEAASAHRCCKAGAGYPRPWRCPTPRS